MKSTKIIFLLLSLLFFFSCKKESFKELPQENEPVFILKGDFDNSDFELIAGENNVIMNSFTEDVNGVQKFSGKLASEDIEVELGIYDFEIDKKDEDQSLSFSSINGAYLPNQPIITFDKNQFYNASVIDNIQWYANNVFIGTNYATISKPGLYNVTALVVFTDGSSGSVSNEVIVGYKQNANYQLNHLLNEEGVLQTWINVQQGDLSNVKWYLDGELISESLDLNIQILDDEEHIVKAKAKFSNGVEKEKSVYIDLNQVSNFISDFSIFETNPTNPVEWDGKAVLIVRKNNVEYRSDYVGNQSLNIKVNSFTYYGKNTLGNDVYILDAIITSNLKSASGTIVPINFSTKFGIEIK